MLADVMTKGLVRERHERLLSMMGVTGTREVTKTATPSRSYINRDKGDVATSGSVELCVSHAVRPSAMAMDVR